MARRGRVIGLHSVRRGLLRFSLWRRSAGIALVYVSPRVIQGGIDRAHYHFSLVNYYGFSEMTARFLFRPTIQNGHFEFHATARIPEIQSKFKYGRTAIDDSR